MGAWCRMDYISFFISSGYSACPGAFKILLLSKKKKAAKDINFTDEVEALRLSNSIKILI
jgi:hypothetical protein